MRNVCAYLCAAGVMAAMPTHLAYAVCLDPKTLVSGYKVALGDEIQTSAAIVVGEVIKVHTLSEDLADPQGITAYIYTVRVLKRLKGTVPAVVRVRSENDSGRYRMNVGEKHLLFLTSKGQYFAADSCGNSSTMSRGQATLIQVNQALSGSHAP